MVNTPPNHNSLKDDSLQQINNAEKKKNQQTKHPLHRVDKTRRKKEKGGGDGGGRMGEEEEQPYFLDEVRHLFASSQTEPECPTAPDV